mgnify:CR=1 FL=1
MMKRLTATWMLSLACLPAYASGVADGVFMDYDWIKSHAQLIDTTVSNRIYAIAPTPQDVQDHTGLVIEIPINLKDGDTMYLAYEQADCEKRQVITLSSKFNYLNGKTTTEWTNQKHALQKAEWQAMTGKAYHDSQLGKRVDFLCGMTNGNPDSKTVFQQSAGE